jgi:BMFP domain-containing protein YqiC
MKDARRIFEEAADAVAAAVPGGLGADMRANVEAALRAALGRLDLVTREELEVQEAVLRRTREKVQALERQVAELESKVLKQP